MEAQDTGVRSPLSVLALETVSQQFAASGNVPFKKNTSTLRVRDSHTVALCVLRHLLGHVK